MNMCDENFMEMTYRYRISNDPQADILYNEQEKAANQDPINENNFGDKFCHINLCFTNSKRREINLAISEYNAQFTESVRLAGFNYPLFIGMPVIAKFNTPIYTNGQRFKITSIGINSITLTRKNEELTINIKDFTKHMDIAYCLTVHSAQGLTIDEEYTIHEWDHKKLPDGFLYTALTRGTCLSNINLMRVHG
jgi:hypothetical protein